MIDYVRFSEDAAHLELAPGFFEAWPQPLSCDQHRAILEKAYLAWLAVDGDLIIGFITAISDGIFSAFLPLLEVLPAYRRQGIGSELVRRMLKSLDHLYMIDLSCDPELQGFYRRHGLFPSQAMIQRHVHKLEWGPGQQ
ncbi:MAG: GNAT family N-acetyltransferase [Clostridiaceae bacterium]|jgi:ribosomal protein S18 acetylase RimI-like enzyme|nr:GNAT family N-acetyltransferase [Clostridiaceae bacterium]